MGSDWEIEEERKFDVEETIFVAVGKNVEESKQVLFWAVQNFSGKKICLLHVYQPKHAAEPMDTSISADSLKQRAGKALQEVERRKLNEILDQYLLVLVQEGVEADKVWIEMDVVEKGIVDIIARNNIRWLVMGGAPERKLAALTSKKAIFVCQQAPISCHVWFVSDGQLVYMRGSLCGNRGGRTDKSNLEIAPPLLLLNSDIQDDQPENSGSESESLSHELRYLEICEDVEGDVNDLERIARSCSSQCSAYSTLSTKSMVGTSKSAPDEEEEAQGQATIEYYSILEGATSAAKSSKRDAVQDTVRRWKEEDSAMEARCKAKALENLCAKEMSQRKELEEVLTREKLEVERMKNQKDEFMKELQMIEEQKSALKGRLEESQVVEKDLEEKFLSAVQLLISFKERRDRARAEHENAVRQVNKLRTMLNGGVARICSVQIPTFSFMEINEATHNFDPSWKIAEGRYGSVYKGILRHVHVAIKMLPFYGSQSQLDFQNRVEVLSRVRHPNLVTIVGTCPESRSIVYEYVNNGSLEDCLSSKENTSPLPWHIRTKIAAEICSALVFFHSSKPCIIHGNLKPSKVLLDANFVSKVGDLGIFHMIPQNEHSAHTIKLGSKPNGTSEYMDPQYLETGKLTPESDVYSFGIILLQLLTGRAVLSIVKDVKCALENKNFQAVLDISAGDWPLKLAKQLAKLGLRCCEKNRLNRPDLVSEIWSLLEPLSASCIISAEGLVTKKPRRVPSHFICPIYQEVMIDPQIAADGYTYESEAIRGWFDSGHNTSPMTNLKLEHCRLVPNYALQNAILEWQQQL